MITRLTTTVAVALAAFVGCTSSSESTGLSSAGGMSISKADFSRQTMAWLQGNNIQVHRLTQAPIKQYIDYVIENTSDSFVVDGTAVSGLQDYLRKVRHLTERKFGSHKTLGDYLKAHKFNKDDPRVIAVMDKVLNSRYMRIAMKSFSGESQAVLRLDDPANEESQKNDDSSSGDSKQSESNDAEKSASSSSGAEAEKKSDPVDSASCEQIDWANIAFSLASMIPNPYVASMGSVGGVSTEIASGVKKCPKSPGACGILVDCSNSRSLSQMKPIEQSAVMVGQYSVPAAGMISDRRLKDILGDYNFGLATVRKLHTVRFRYKKDNPLDLPSLPEYSGFIAQELQQVIPQAVIKRSDGFLQVDFTPVHWAVVNSVQELANENDKLRADVQGLKGEITVLKKILCATSRDASICAN